MAIYLALFQLYPLLQEFWLSFTGTQLLTPQDNPWLGLDNYSYLLSDGEFQQVLLVTATSTVACVVLAIGLGLVAALLLDAPFAAAAWARALVTVPWAAPSVAAAVASSPGCSTRNTVSSTIS